MVSVPSKVSMALGRHVPDHAVVQQDAVAAGHGQRPPPPVRRHPRHPEPPGRLPVAGARLDQISSGQPHPLAAGPLCASQPAAVGGTSWIRHSALRRPSPEPVTPAVEDL
jgi:hypothetical protein